MNTVYLLLGSNEGDRKYLLGKAIDAISTFGTVVKRSSLYETAAWGLETQPEFLNMVLEVHTELSAEAVLNKIQQTENNLGRQRKVLWGQRTLDIDILFFNDEIIDTENLKVPHPYMQERRFTLAPLSEIAGSLVHPILRLSIEQLMENCEDMLPARRLSEHL